MNGEWLGIAAKSPSAPGNTAISTSFSKMTFWGDTTFKLIMFT
jgi:hypothetical protein